MTLADVIDLLERVPATFLGVVFGSFFSLGGVFLTNRSNNNRLKAQLAHDRDLKNRERELSMRKEIYLAVAEAITEGLNAIYRFADISTSNEKLTERYVDRSASISKAHVIAKIDTAKAIAALTADLGTTYLKLFALRQPLLAQKARMDILLASVDTFAKERNRMLELMKEHNLEGKADDRQWKFLQDSFDYEQGRVTQALDQHNELAADLKIKQVELFLACHSEIAKLRKLLLPVLVAVREELELSIDEEAYTKILEENTSSEEQKLKEFFQSVQAVKV